MKAAVLDRYGPPDVLRVADVPKPVPGDNEVLVRVHAATVSAGDVRLRLANPFFVRFFFGLFGPRFRIPGFPLAGTIEETGRRVTGYRKGDAVYGTTGMKFRANAEFACVTSGPALSLKPTNATFEEAAAVIFGGESALHFLRQADVKAGQRVLIYGASGSVGTAMVQLAKHAGAQVTGVCSTANLALVKSLGADDVVDYTKDDFSKSGRVYDVVVDAVGKAGLGRLMRSLKPGGVCVLVSSSLTMYLVALIWAAVTGRARIVGGVARVQPGDLALLKGLVEAGQFKPVIDRVYPLDDIVEAHRYAETGRVKGNVVIKIG
jgi:NADPH:quinone reductase-like Zn-dependent oxidoreductase